MELTTFKKGDARHLDGRLLAYAHVASALTGAAHLQGMVHNGLLAVQGNYRDQRTLAEFFQSEFGLSLERGIEEVIEQSRDGSGLEGALDPDLVRERLRSMKDAAGMMPIPAKVVPLDSELTAMGFEGDVADLGFFDDLAFAHMAVNSFPILYQAHYRQQEYVELQNRIDTLLDAPTSASRELQTFTGDVETYLLQTLLPSVLYAKDDSSEAGNAMERFRTFLQPHLTESDLDAVLALLPIVRKGDAKASQRLDLLLRRAAALHREDFRSLEAIRQSLEKLDSGA